ncbi:MAG: MarC family protein [Chloroflexi bacterium]|nr:MarC family protein [Chloroflexota bacterium]MDA1272032.1 MarC family protein [Chloroflexota bacterium]
MDYLKDFYLVFLPLLVVMDPLSVLPFWVPLIGAVPKERRQRVTGMALVTGLVIGLMFLGLGKGIFIALGISVADFVIAGGVVLLAISLRELVSSTATQAPVAPDELTAVVPIGTPLLVGPATISLLIVLTGLYDTWLVVIAFLANIVVAWLVFSQSHRIVRVLGQGGLQAFSKVAYLLLAGIAVQLIRRGIMELIQEIE